MQYDTYESDEMLETRLLSGRTNYDIVGPSDLFFDREIRAGVFRKLDVNLDPAIMHDLALHDPGNLYGVPYA